MGDQLRDPMSLLRYLWTATGYDSEIRVCDLFSDDDPIRFDIEAVLGEVETHSLSREGLPPAVGWDANDDYDGSPSREGLPTRDELIALAEKHFDIGEYGSGSGDPEGLADAILARLSSPPDLALSEGIYVAEPGEGGWQVRRHDGIVYAGVTELEARRWADGLNAAHSELVLAAALVGRTAEEEGNG